MKLHPEDPRLTAYLLGELGAEEASAVERACAADPAIRLALRDMERVQILLAGTLAPASITLLPRQRDNIRRRARQAGLEGKVVTLASHRRSWKPWLIPISSAAAIILGITILTRLPSGEGGTSARNLPVAPANWDKIPLEIALLPAPGPADASHSANATDSPRATAGSGLAERTAARDTAIEKTGDEFLRKVAESLESSPAPSPSDLPDLIPRGLVIAAENPTLELPVHSGRASLGWIRHSIEQERTLPVPQAVRLEEVLNSFALRPAGATAIAGGATLSTEIIACPWKPSAALLIVSIRGAGESAREVRPVFHADVENVRRYRLLGFSTLVGVEPGKLPSRLPAKSVTTLAIEIESLGSASSFGTLEWTIDGQPAAPVPLIRQVDGEPSDDARFAALLCTFAQWLSGEQAGVIDGELVAALAREVDSPSLSAERTALLDLINQALKL